MIVEFVHPAIVSGAAADGAARADVVRVQSHFDIAEYDASQAPLSFEYNSSGSYFMHPVRTIGDCHYLGLPYANGLDALREGSLFHTSLVGGHWESFEPVWQIVRDRVSDIRAAGFVTVNNAKRDVTKRERSNGVYQEGKACLNAPMLKAWRWLGADVDSQVAEWRGIVAELLENAILVDGVLHVRCFEPSLVLNTVNGVPKTEVSSRGVYQRQVHKREYDRDGLIVMGKDATNTLSHYFAVNDVSGLEGMRDALGWKVGKRTWVANVVDAGAVSADYLEMETVRHARILHEFGSQYAHYLGRKGHGDLSLSFELAACLLKEALLAWQEDADAFAGVVAATAPLADLITEAPPRDRGQDRFGLDPVFCQRRIAQFGFREDVAEVSFDMKPPVAMR